MTIVTDLLLALSIVAAWLGAFGLLRLRAPLDGLHAVTFLNAAAGLAMVLAGFTSDGISVRSVKLLALVLLVLVLGAAQSHASGRALLLRDGPTR